MKEKSSNNKNEKEDKNLDFQNENDGILSLYKTFDPSMINVISICNFAQGFKRLVDLGLYFVYKDKLGLQPSEIEILIGIINFPWVAKVVLAILADNYTLFGSRRKSYLFTACVINLFSLFILMIFSIKFGKYFITFCIFMTQLCMTMCDALTDALIV